MKWKPGQSGNPAGRPPKGETLTDVLREYAEKKREGSPLDRKHELALKLYELAIEREDFQAIKYIYDRIDGRPKEFVKHSGDEEAPLMLVLEPVRADEE